MKNRIVTYVNPELSVKVLNRLFAKLDCSLARYLSYARPWARRPYMLLDALARGSAMSTKPLREASRG